MNQYTVVEPLFIWLPLILAIAGGALAVFWLIVGIIKIVKYQHERKLAEKEAKGVPNK